MRNENGPSLFSASPAPSERGAAVISVTELNRRARQLLEARFELLWVAGELSNVLRAASGHWYFSLKDRDAQVRCVMFRNRAAAIGFVPENGMQVEVRALPSLYEPRGEFQLGVESMRRAGLGALYEAYERLKQRLQDEGLFDATRKRPIPAFPRTVGVVTSLKAAALRDVITTLRRRAPMLGVIIYPTAVQGTAAAQEIAAAIDAARTRREVDTLIVCRGGGSIEDLWSFNEEAVARAVARLQDEAGIPVISGVGHETDFTICDFVADLRAPTPTAAAEIASPDVIELRGTLADRRAALGRAQQRLLDGARQRIDRAASALVSPADRLRRERDRLALLAARGRHALAQRLDAARFAAGLARQRLLAGRPDIDSLRDRIRQLRARMRLDRDHRLTAWASALAHRSRALAHLDPARVLERGYGIVLHNGRVLRDAADVRHGARVHVRVARGEFDADVTGPPSPASD